MPRFDAIVVGGGLIGGAIALELARLRQRVLLVDKEQPGREASWAAGGMLSPGHDAPEVSALGRESLEIYPAFVADVEAASRLKCGFRPSGALELFFGPDAEAERDRLIAAHHALNLDTQPIPIADAREKEPAINSEARAAAWFPNEATIEPRLLTDALLTAAVRRGVEIRPHTTVTAILRDQHRCLGVVTEHERIHVGRVVIAAGCFSGKIEGIGAYAPTKPVRGQMVLVRPPELPSRPVRSSRGYVVPWTAGRAVAGSTLEDAGFEKQVTPEGLLGILRAAVELLPGLASAPIVETWSGLRPDTPDHLPLMGPADLEGLFLATGHYRSGILMAPLTAKIIGRWITKGSPGEDVSAFSPLRFLTHPQPAPR